jgi:CRISPR-associated endoribonuclease Cas6
MPVITRINITIEATQTVAWPHFAGSTLRGAFGRALRQAACVTKQPGCDACPMRSSCAYGVVFDPAPPMQALHPSFRDGLPRYLVQAPALGACQLLRGQSQNFNLVLLPGAQSHQRLIEHILKSAVEQQLLQPGLFKLRDTLISSATIADFAAVGTPLESLRNTQRGTSGLAIIRLNWLTPFRLQLQGKPIFNPKNLDSTALVRALLRRQMQWCQLTGQARHDGQAQLQAATSCTLDTGNMQWHDIHRHSGSQSEKQPMGGLIGRALLQGPTPALQLLTPLLQLGEQLHVGKEVVMGLGRYQLGAIDTC